MSENQLQLSEVTIEDLDRARFTVRRGHFNWANASEESVRAEFRVMRAERPSGNDFYVTFSCDDDFDHDLNSVWPESIFEAIESSKRRGYWSSEDIGRDMLDAWLRDDPEDEKTIALQNAWTKFAWPRKVNEIRRALSGMSADEAIRLFAEARSR